MSTAINIPIIETPITDQWVELARRKFVGFSSGSFKGTGPFALVTRCPTFRRVLLFDSPHQRARRLEQWDRSGCCSSCTDAHQIVELSQENICR